MSKAVYLVYSRASSPDREDEYNDWYDNVHLAEVCSIDGVSGASRFQLADDEADPGLHEYLAIYEFDADDPNTVVEAIMAAGIEGRFNMSDALQLDPPPVTRLYVGRD
jgi:hypothetical protein